MLLKNRYLIILISFIFLFKQISYAKNKEYFRSGINITFITDNTIGGFVKKSYEIAFNQIPKGFNIPIIGCDFSAGLNLGNKLLGTPFYGSIPFFISLNLLFFQLNLGIEPIIRFIKEESSHKKDIYKERLYNFLFNFSFGLAFKIYAAEVKLIQFGPSFPIMEETYEPSMTYGVRFIHLTTGIDYDIMYHYK